MYRIKRNHKGEKMRKESDSIGVLEVPEEAYYGVQTLRGFENF